MMIIENKYEIGDIVYLTTDREQLERLVTQLRISPCGLIYIIQNGINQSEHYEMELSAEKNLAWA